MMNNFVFNSSESYELNFEAQKIIARSINIKSFTITEQSQKFIRPTSISRRLIYQHPVGGILQNNLHLIEQYAHIDVSTS